MGEDRTPPVRRTTVAEAAEILGISAEAVRGRIRRGTLPVEREGGTVYVLLAERATDQPRTTIDQPTDRTDLLIAELQDRIRALEEANRENRRIIAALTSRIPELPPPATAERPSEAPREATERPGRVGPQTTIEGLAEEPREAPETAAQELHQTLEEEVRDTPSEKPPDTREYAVTPEPGRAGPRDEEPLEGDQEGTQRPWWRRMFGG